MLSFPSFVVGSNLCNCGVQNDNPITFPVIVSLPAFNCITPYGSNPNFLNPLMMNPCSPNCNVQFNSVVNNKLGSLDLTPPYSNGMNNISMESRMSPELSQKNAEVNNNLIKDSINLINSSNSELKLDCIKKNSRVHFTKKEDDRIKELVERFGKKNWSIIASFMNGRSAKQCRDRYCNYLVPGFFQGEWSKEEDDLLLKLYKENGSKWSIIQGYFPKRSSNSVKNRWYYFLRKKYEEEENRKKNEEEKNKETNENNEKENVVEAQVELNIVEDESNEEEENTKTEFFAIPDEVQMQPKENDNIFEINRNVLDSLNENGWMLFD